GPAAEPSWLAGWSRYGYLGVHLFFIISGFVIFLSVRRATPREFVASRVSRLYPAFWVAVLLTWAVVQGFNVQALKVSFVDMLVNLTMVPHWFELPFVDGAYWSLAVEIQFYILVWLALKFRLMAHAEWLLAAWLAIAGINALRPMYPLQLWLAAQWAPLFCVGACAYLIRMHGLSKGRLALLSASYLLALYYAVKGSGVSPATHNPWVIAAFITTFVGIFVLMAFQKISLRKFSGVTLAGALTYPVYLLHEYIGYVALSGLKLAGWGFLPGLFVVWAGLWLGAWLLHRLVERPLGPRLRAALSTPRAARVHTE